MLSHAKGLGLLSRSIIIIIIVVAGVDTYACFIVYVQLGFAEQATVLTGCSDLH